ncbi:hypothetical protein QTG56_24045 (plasmid) [Rossellomorea sp. AcN35-11]|nr:hypothetical protein [Rossellomorea aquimaris]WJV31711.1 hypothetical protein QTG56_24045 [Rossellomorea sp. AcN35-11]
MRSLKESDLFEPVKRLLIEKVGCEKVYAEVLHYDVVAVIGNHDIIVEMKKVLNFKVIQQAVEARRHGHYVFIAVPYKKSGIQRIVKDFLKYHGIGLIIIKDETVAEIPTGLFASFNRKTGDIRKYIKDGYHDTIPGGSKMGDFDYQSDYTLMIDDIRRFLKRRKQGKWVTVDEILEHCSCYYSKPKPQLTQTLKANWNSDWLEWKVENRKSHFRIKE